jgi:uncharacterized protein YdeI (YjbR/CyaY-like superfamily)
MNNKHQTVEEYITNSSKWKVEMEMLQSCLIDCGLNETLKWGVPCYMYNKSNLVLIGSFKEFVSLSFFKGALLADPENLLHKPGENSQSARMFKFTHSAEISNLEKTIKAYIYEAIEVEKAGLTVSLNKSSDLTFPAELLAKFDKDEAFKDAFFSLTPGRQRGYNLFFSDSKQAKTREVRIEKYKERILKGIGIHDCVCGLSKRMPRCDGSHKQLA